MKLTVKDFGAIKKKSEIDLDKRFYVFVGYNNSGKTYMSQLMWAFHKYLPVLPNYLAKVKELDSFFEINKQSIVLNINKELINFVLKDYHIFLKQKFNFLSVSLENLLITYSNQEFEYVIKTPNYFYRMYNRYYAVFKEVANFKIEGFCTKHIELKIPPKSVLLRADNLLDIEENDINELKIMVL